MSSAPLGLVAANQSWRDSVVAANRLCRYALARITGKPVKWHSDPDKPVKPAAPPVVVFAPPIMRTVTSTRDRERRREKLGPSLPRWSVRAIVVAICRVSKVRPGEIVSPRRPRRIAHPRQLAMYILARSRPDLSTPQIGKIFGGRDHTTVLHAFDKVPARIAADSDTARWFCAAIAILDQAGAGE